MLAVQVTKEDLTRSRLKLEDKLTGGSTYRIKDKLTEMGKQNNDPSSAASIDSFFNCFSVIDVLYDRLKAKHLLDNNLANIVSTYVGADYGLKCLEIRHNGSTISSERNVFSGESVNLRDFYPNPRIELVDAYLKQANRHSSMATSALTEQFFNWMKDKALSESETMPDQKKLDTIQGKILEDFSFHGLSAKTKRYEEKKGEFTWDNFVGYEEVVTYFKDLQLIVEQIDKVLSLDVLPLKDIIPKGTLLVGPPRTGKTTLARIFCNESGIPYDIFGISEVGTKFVNDTANNVQKKFDEAARYIKSGESRFSLLFIDELDTLGKLRSGSTNGAGEDDKVVTTINYNMDGHLAVDGVILIGATNRLDILDPALTNSGRFAVWKYMEELTREDALNVLKLYTSKGCNNINTGEILSRYYQPKKEEHAEKIRGISWTGGFIRDVTTRAKRAKLIEHLKTGADYRISNSDIYNEIEKYKISG